MIYNLQRFILAQESMYETALKEIRNGHKRSHWMWYIFPQIAGLGLSTTAQKYAIADLDEAKAYIETPYLRENLINICRALLQCNGDIEKIMGCPDNLKLCSSMTLFELAAPHIPEFRCVLNKFFGGKADRKTIELIFEKGDFTR